MPSWPSSLPSPSQNYGFGVIGRGLIGRGGRVFKQTRARDGETVLVVDVEFVFDDTEFQTFREFFEITLFDGALPFDIRLSSGDGLQAHEVFFMEGKFSASSGHGLTHSISAQLVCHRPPILEETYLDDLLSLDGEFSFLDVVDALEELVETTLPNLF